MKIIFRFMLIAILSLVLLSACGQSSAPDKEEKAAAKKQQDAVLKAAAEVEASQWAASEKRHTDSLKVIQEHGIVVTEVSPELSKDLNQAAKQLVMEFQKKASKDVQAVLKKYTD